MQNRMLMKNKPVKQSLRSLEGCSRWGALGSPLQDGQPTAGGAPHTLPASEDGQMSGDVCTIWEAAPGAQERGCGPDRHEQEGKSRFGASKYNYCS